MKNKIIAFMLAVVMCFSSASIAFAENAPVVKEITLSMYCNLSDKNSITGVYSNKNFYVSAEDLCDVTNGKLKSQTDEETVISCNHSLREITINHSTQKMTDGFIINESFDIPVIEYKGKMYYSLPHFLNLLDYKYEFNQDSETPLKIFADYNIFDAIGDFSKENKKICFSWDEMGCTVKDLKKRLINYGVVALVNRNSDIFKMMFDAKGIEREALEENLITILTSEGEDYLIKDESWLDNLNLENDAFSYGKDTMDFILNTYKSKIGAEYVEAIINETDKYAKPASALVEIANVLATAEQYSSITGTQRKLIEDTILKNADKSPMLQGEWNRMIEAAENVNDRVKSAYENYSAATTEFIENSISDKAKEIMLAEESFAFDVVSPIYYAWKGSLLFTNKLFKPTAKIVEKKTQFYNAYNCSMVQMIARELLVNAVEYLNQNGIMVSDIVAQQKNFYQIKNSMILELKSSLATREYLIKSKLIDDDFANSMKELNKQTAILLNKVERCHIVSILPGKLVANDLTWMEKYERIEKLDFRMEEKHYSSASTEAEKYSNDIEYPLFLGSSKIDKKLNSEYAELINNSPRKGLEDNQWREDEEYITRIISVTYNENGYISLSENLTEIRTGIVHHYNYGTTYNLQTAQEVEYSHFFIGDAKKIENLINEKVRDEGFPVYRNNWYEDSPYVLKREGICFYYFAGDAVHDKEICIPYTDGKVPYVYVE